MYGIVIDMKTCTLSMLLMFFLSIYLLNDNLITHSFFFECYLNQRSACFVVCKSIPYTLLLKPIVFYDNLNG